MAFFNIDSLEIDEEFFPPDRNEIKKVVRLLKNKERHGSLLVDNNFEVIGRPEVYYAHLEIGKKGVYGQRITEYKKNSKYPDRFSVEISSHCNYSCPMCPRTAMYRKNSFMKKDLFCKIIDDISKHDVSMVDLHRLGESTLHPRFFEFMDYIEGLEKPIVTSLATNGGNLNLQTFEKLMQTPITILVMSINASSPEFYRTVTGGKGDFDHVNNLVMHAKKFKTKRAPFFGVQFIEQDGTVGELEDFVDKYLDHVDFVESSMLEDFGGQLEQNSNYIHENNYDAGGPDRREVCQRVKWGRFRIYSNGDVVPCICDINAEFMKMGNMNEHSVEEIFRNSEWENFRQLHFEGRANEHPLCANCTDWKIYSNHNKKHSVVTDAAEV